METRHVVTCFLINDERFLILRRSEKVRTMKGRWAGVSGYVEGEEDIDERAFKEVQEETGIDRSALRLVRRGGKVAAPDSEEADVLWIVHPYLFETSTSNVALNWESDGHRWVHSYELTQFDAVPRLREVLDAVIAPEDDRPTDEVQGTMNVIRKDRSSGASTLARESLRALAREAEVYQAADVEAFRLHLKSVAYQLMDCRPSMAPLQTLMSNLLFALNYSGETHTAADLRKLTLAVVSELSHAAEIAVRKVAENATGVLEGFRTVLSNTYSSTVMETLKVLSEKSHRMRVVVLESRPLLEGRRTALELRQRGLDVTLVVDAAAGRLMKETDGVIVGADGVLGDGSVVNKVGTYPLALAAHDQDVPFHVLADTFKFNVASLLDGDVALEEKEGTEVFMPPEGSKVKVRNPYFDITPARLISLIITEDRIVKPQEVDGVFQSVMRKVSLR
ncbi:MAG: NUDIX domain-containing protein [Candidatus Bathyarchaeia archaeon]